MWFFPQRAVVLVMSLGLLLSAPAAARTQDSGTTEQKVVRFALILDGEQVLEASAKRDDMVTVEITDRGHYGFLPEIQANGTVFMEIFSLESGPRKLIERVQLNPGQRVQLIADSGLALILSETYVIGTATAQPRATIRLASLYSRPFTQFAAASMDCCIQCGNVTSCGCAVTMSCGCCCSDGCTNRNCRELECSPGLASGTQGGAGECGLKFESIIAALPSRGE